MACLQTRKIPCTGVAVRYVADARSKKVSRIVYDVPVPAPRASRPQPFAPHEQHFLSLPKFHNTKQSSRRTLGCIGYRRQQTNSPARTLDCAHHCPGHCLIDSSRVSYRWMDESAHGFEFEPEPQSRLVWPADTASCENTLHWVISWRVSICPVGLY